MLAVLILALASAASAAQNSAFGNLTIGKDTFEMKYAAAMLTGEGTRIVLADKRERKKLKRAARKKAAPKPKRASGVARGSTK